MLFLMVKDVIIFFVMRSSTYLYEYAHISKDFEVFVQICQVGARFEALDELVFMAPSEFFGIFFTTQTKPFEQCD